MPDAPRGCRWGRTGARNARRRRGGAGVRGRARGGVCAGAGSGRALGQRRKHGRGAAAEQVSRRRAWGRAPGCPERAAEGRGAAGPRERAAGLGLAGARPSPRPHSGCEPGAHRGPGLARGRGVAQEKLSRGPARIWGSKGWRRGAEDCPQAAPGLRGPQGLVQPAGWPPSPGGGGGWAQWALFKGPGALKGTGHVGLDRLG